MDFVVIDVETANPQLSSICQIGIAPFSEGQLCHSWKSLINPQDYFDHFHTSIHGISERIVQTAPTWSEVYPMVIGFLSGQIVVSHTTFDRAAIRRACEKFALPEYEFSWLDSASVARHTWEDPLEGGYGLGRLAKRLGIRYRAHDALGDARCAGEVLLRAIAETGISADKWADGAKPRFKYYSHPLPPCPPPSHALSTFEPNSQGPLYGEVVVFTGTLAIPRYEAASLAASLGCQVEDNVTKHTTLLVVGDRDPRQLPEQKSGKHRKAEALILKGQHIRILVESDFERIVSDASAEFAALCGAGKA